MPNPVANLNINGRSVRPDDEGWDSAHEAFNTRIDQRPEAMVFPADEADVVTIVNYAREHGLRIAPQATAHNAGPLGSLDGTLVVQTSDLQHISIDPAGHRVRVGSGVKWEKIAPQLSDHGLAGLHGSSPDVGIAGYSLGGGIGWLARKYGMQTNSVTAIELVTSDGQFIRATAQNHPDLFWALRGGNGNYGVVTAIEFAVYPVEELYAGAMFFPFERASEVLHTWRELLPTFPDELMTWANILHFPPLPELPEQFRGQSYVIVMGAYLGEEPEGRDLLRRVRDLGPAIDTFAMVPPAVLGDLAMDPPDPLPITSGHELLEELPASLIDEFLSIAGPESDSGNSLTLFNLRHMGGALARKSPGAGARATLAGEVSLFVLGVVEDDEAARAVDGRIARLVAAAQPYRAGEYPNFVEEPADASAFFDTETWQRLREVKALYDPEDMFKGNHHIPPAERIRQAA
ncbi:MAG TPA: FAD-binding oxidoreductase [Thermoleophilaceae bacterium]|nr:FAD-binding oxidoreductase [Thermoleophilaceae bacterium]